MSTERILSLASLAPKEGTIGQKLSQVSPGTNGRQDYYLHSLHPSQKINRMGHDPVQSTNEILQECNFSGTTEEMDESIVVLLILLDLSTADFLSLSGNTHGGFNDPQANKGKCFFWTNLDLTLFTLNEFKQMFSSCTLTVSLRGKSS